MRYARRRKNLNPYDVVKIASMVDREATLAAERGSVASVIYNRLEPGRSRWASTQRSGSRTGNWSEPADASRSWRPARRTTRARTRACRRGRSATRGSRRSRPRPTRRRPTTSTTSSSREPAASTHSPKPTREFQHDASARTASSRSGGGKSPTPADGRRAARRRSARHAGGAQPLAADDPSSAALAASAALREMAHVGVPRGARRERYRRSTVGPLPGSGYRRHQRHDPAQARGVRARRRADRRRHARSVPSTRSASRTAGSTGDNTDAPGLSTRSAARQGTRGRSSSAPVGPARAAAWALRRRGRRGLRSGTGPRERGRPSLLPTSGSATSRSRERADLVVNARRSGSTRPATRTRRRRRPSA